MDRLSFEEILDLVLRITFDWWSDQQQRDIASDGGDDMEKFISMAKEVCRQNFTTPPGAPAVDTASGAILHTDGSVEYLPSVPAPAAASETTAVSYKCGICRDTGWISDTGGERACWHGKPAPAAGAAPEGAPIDSCMICGHCRTLAAWHAVHRVGVCGPCRDAAYAAAYPRQAGAATPDFCPRCGSPFKAGFCGTCDLEQAKAAEWSGAAAPPVNARETLVRNMAAVMREKLNRPENRAKGDNWGELDLHHLFGRLEQECSELRAAAIVATTAAKWSDNQQWLREAGNEAADVANISAMIADKVGAWGRAVIPQAAATPGDAVLVQLVRDMLPFVEEWRQGDEHNPEGRREWWESVLKRAEMALAQGGKAQ